MPSSNGYIGPADKKRKGWGGRTRLFLRRLRRHGLKETILSGHFPVGCCFCVIATGLVVLFLFSASPTMHGAYDAGEVDYVLKQQRAAGVGNGGGDLWGSPKFRISPGGIPAASSISDAIRDAFRSSDLNLGTLGGVDVGDSATAFNASGLARDLRTISVVLPCAGENTLMINTARSIVEATPNDVLAEVIVVDDGSDPPLEQFWPKDEAPETQKVWDRVLGKVRMMRHESTRGLMNARTTGANAAKGDIIAMLDCHVKPDPQWYVSIVREISENYRRLTIPVITNLDVDTWEEVGARPAPGGGMSACYFAWDSEFKWYSDRFYDNSGKRYIPMLSGGLLAMSKQWWTEMGGYDEKMTGWGGENIDQGLRVWMCGGEIISLTDSYVAHMWRSSDPKTHVNYKHVGDSARNRWRAVHAWLSDPFEKKTLSYPDFHRFADGYEDVSNYKEVQDRLKCKPFIWYIDRFADLFHRAGLLPRTVFRLESRGRPGFCLERTGSVLGNAKVASGPLGIAPCDPSSRMQLFHAANRAADGECCSGIRGYDSDQCIRIHGPAGSIGDTAVCSIDGSSSDQQAMLRPLLEGSVEGGGEEILIEHGNYRTCVGVKEDEGSREVLSRACFEANGGREDLLSVWDRRGEKTSMERTMYESEREKYRDQLEEWNLGSDEF